MAGDSPRSDPLILVHACPTAIDEEGAELEVLHDTSSVCLCLCLCSLSLSLSLKHTRACALTHCVSVCASVSVRACVCARVDAWQVLVAEPAAAVVPEDAHATEEGVVVLEASLQ